jgi:hypothetical protein
MMDLSDVKCTTPPAAFRCDFSAASSRLVRHVDVNSSAIISAEVEGNALAVDVASEWMAVREQGRLSLRPECGG